MSAITRWRPPQTSHSNSSTRNTRIINSGPGEDAVGSGLVSVKYLYSEKGKKCSRSGKRRKALPGRERGA